MKIKFKKCLIEVILPFNEDNTLAWEDSSNVIDILNDIGKCFNDEDIKYIGEVDNEQSI